VLTGRFIDIEI